MKIDISTDKNLCYYEEGVMNALYWKYTGDVYA